MSVAENFKGLCDNLAVTNQAVISGRYHRITQRINYDFWASTSDTAHSLYVGSYGRDTAIRGISDIDMIAQLPWSLYSQYEAYVTNGQSALLQAVKTSLQKSYPSSFVGADGQVVVVSFTDMRFEVLPAFLHSDGSYTYADTNNGGRWRTTNPRPEIDAMYARNIACNFNLKRLCRMARAWKQTNLVAISGLLIDTLAYRFIDQWPYKDKSYLYYDWMVRDFFEYLANQPSTQQFWAAPLSGQSVWRTGSFERKAKAAFNLAVDAIKDESNGYIYVPRGKWREIFGYAYP